MKSNNEKIVAIIPARLESSRLPRKALANILGLPMIIHVLKRCLIANSVDDVYVATDSDEIRSVVESYRREQIELLKLQKKLMQKL